MTPLVSSGFDAVDAGMIVVLVSGLICLLVGLVLSMWRLRDAAEQLKQTKDKDILEAGDLALQAIVVAKMALDLGDTERAKSALQDAINSTSGLISGLTGLDRARLQRRMSADPTDLPETSTNGKAPVAAEDAESGR